MLFVVIARLCQSRTKAVQTDCFIIEKHSQMEPKIETARLILRKPRLEDARAIFDNYAQDEESVRYMSWKRHEQLTDAVSFVQGVIAEWESGKLHQWAIEEKATGEMIGMISCGGEPTSVMGYVLAPHARNKGYTTEAGQALIERAFENPQVYRVEAICDTANTPSYRVMEKLGMQREGLLRKRQLCVNLSAVPRDIYIYAKVRE